MATGGFVSSTASPVRNGLMMFSQFVAGNSFLFMSQVQHGEQTASATSSQATERMLRHVGIGRKQLGAATEPEVLRWCCPAVEWRSSCDGTFSIYRPLAATCRVTFNLGAVIRMSGVYDEASQSQWVD
jgi:hypothetical protein